MPRAPPTDAYWRAFRAAAGLDHDRHEVVAFGDGRAMADELAELVVNGPTRATEVTIKPLSDVDDAFAWDEGEGDRSRDDWLAGHRRYFACQAAREGFTFHDRIETVFERITVVWPPEAADS